MSKDLVLFSGGLDSSVALAQAVSRNGSGNVIALSIYYGQKHDKETKAAERVAQYYNVELLRLDLSEIFKFGGSTLLKGGGEIESGNYAQQLKGSGLIATYVPFRNGLMLSAAASVAMAKSASTVIYGAHRDDATAAYPDCTAEFLSAISSSVFLGSGGLITVKAPFIDMTKGQIVREGLRLSVPFELTWSCYRGGDKPCGECATCLDRAKAFAANGAGDPAIKN